MRGGEVCVRFEPPTFQTYTHLLFALDSSHRSSTADKGGIAEGDEIIQVDDTKLDQRTPFQAASLIQGGDDEASTPTQPTTTLTVRKPNGTVLQVELARPEKPVSKSPVTYRMERSPGENKTGYIQLTGFNAQAQRKVKEAVVALEKDGAKRLILDLRDNRGGLVSEGIEVARLFLDNESVVVVTEGRAKSSDKPITAPGPALTKLPMVVLVNEHTASASEILAGSLRDNCRAVVAGTRTYGKGLIQSVYELGDGSGLVVTVGKYLTPGLTDIDQSGIVPDFKYVLVFCVPSLLLLADLLIDSYTMHVWTQRVHTGRSPRCRQRRILSNSARSPRRETLAVSSRIEIDKI